jgi:hypothetical protein
LAPSPVRGAVLPAQAVCLPRAELARHLAERFGEAAVAAGLAADGAVLEVFATPDGDSWTIAVTVPGGPSCVVAVGRQWQARPASPGPGAVPGRERGA